MLDSGQMDSPNFIKNFNILNNQLIPRHFFEFQVPFLFNGFTIRMKNNFRIFRKKHLQRTQHRSKVNDSKRVTTEPRIMVQFRNTLTWKENIGVFRDFDFNSVFYLI